MLCFTAQIVLANCVVRSKNGKFYYFAGLNCERDFLISAGEGCWNVATPPPPKNTITALEVRTENGKEILYAKINGTWEEVAEVTGQFVLPDPSDAYETSES